MKILPFTPRVGMILGTTSASPLAMVIKSRTAGPGKMFSQDVASHIVCVIRWKDSYAKILEAIEASRGITIKHPGVKSGEYIGVEATWPCTRLVKLDKYVSRTPTGAHYVFVAYPCDLDDEQDEQISKLLVNKVGTPYDFAALFECLGFMNDNPNRDCCSETPRDALRSMGYNYPKEYDFGVSPWDWQMHFEAAQKMIWTRYKKFWG
jgi:hypothetical protein